MSSSIKISFWKCKTSFKNPFSIVSDNRLETEYSFVSLALSNIDAWHFWFRDRRRRRLHYRGLLFQKNKRRRLWFEIWFLCFYNQKRNLVSITVCVAFGYKAGDVLFKRVALFKLFVLSTFFGNLPDVAFLGLLCCRLQV